MEAITLEPAGTCANAPTVMVTLAERAKDFAATNGERSIKSGDPGLGKQCSLQKAHHLVIVQSKYWAVLSHLQRRWG